MACGLIGTLKLMTLWFGPNSFATLSGVIFSIGTFGSMVATTPLVLLVGFVGWRLAFSFIAGFTLLIAFVFHGVVRDTPPGGAHAFHPAKADARDDDIFTSLRLLLNSREYWIASCGSFFRYGIFAAVQTLWAGPYLMGPMLLSPLETANLILLMNIALIIGVPVWGWLSDRVLKTRKGVVLLGFASLCITMFTIAMLSPGTRLLILAVLFFCFGFSSGTGMVMITHVKEHMPIEMSGVAMTGINFFTMIGAAILVQGLGSLMQHFYPHASQGIDAFRWSFRICAVCLFLVSLLFCFSRDAKTNHEYKINL
jgi:sugar phosphate permease